MKFPTFQAGRDNSKRYVIKIGSVRSMILVYVIFSIFVFQFAKVQFIPHTDKKYLIVQQRGHRVHRESRGWLNTNLHVIIH